MKFDIANIADVFADVVIKGREKPSFGQVETLADDYELELGGSGPIFSSQFTKLGGKVAMLTIVGDDSMGDFIIKRMEEIGIDTRFTQISKLNKTPLGLNISVQEDRSMMTVLGTLEEISSALVDESLLDSVRHWHIAGYFLLPALIPFWPDFLVRLKTLGISVSLDTNWAPEGNWEQVMQILPLVDVFLPNEEEALAITGASAYGQAGAILSKKIPLVVIKRGASGASVFKGEREIRVTNQDVWKGRIMVKDTTGAGDSFDGGFLYEWLQGSDLEKCLDTALTCGISNVQGIGGIQSQYRGKPTAIQIVKKQ